MKNKGKCRENSIGPRKLLWAEGLEEKIIKEKYQFDIGARAIFLKLCACLAYLVDVCVLSSLFNVLHLFCVVFVTNMSFQ